MSIMSYNGGCVLAMKGKGCVTIAADKQFHVQGLATDTKTVNQRLRFRVNMYELRENRRIKPSTFFSLISGFMYERRFSPYFIEPIVAGIDDKTGEPFIGSMDLLGNPGIQDDFVVAGTCDEQLLGICETLWEPDLGPDELFEVTAQALLNANAQDAGSGWGGIVYIIEKDAVTIKEVRSRMD